MHKLFSFLIAAALFLTSAAPLVQAQSFTAPLTLGSEGPEVTALQNILIEKGYLKVPATGYFGLLTKNALAAFQADNGLESVGSLGPKTRALLNTKTTTTPTASTKTTTVTEPTFKLGQRGEAVKALQRKLKAAGFYKNRKITGYYGSTTKRAHDAYLAAQKTTADKANTTAGKTPSKSSSGSSKSTPKKESTSEGTTVTPKNPTATTTETVATPTTPKPTTTSPKPTTPKPTTTTPATNSDLPKYAPPTLTNPTTITLGTGYTSTKLDNTKDYIIKFPSTRKTGATHITGGRNIVIQGGYISIPESENGVGGVHQRSLQIDKAKGTVHIEGLLIDGSAGGESDAIVISAPEAIVQVVNVRVDGIMGKNSTWHADIIQPWGGVKELRVDRLTGSSYYQGFQLYVIAGAAPTTKIGSLKFSNVNLTSLGEQTKDSGGQLIWLTDSGIGCSSAVPTTFENVYINERPTKGFGNAVYPFTKTTGCPAVVTGNTLTWPDLPVTGVVNRGKPAADYVPAGTVGLGYVSPFSTTTPKPTTPSTPTAPETTTPTTPTEPVTPPVTTTPTAAKPTITFSSDKSAVTVGESFVLTWATQNATSCTGSGSWSGTIALNGTKKYNTVSTGTKKYTLSCTGEGGTISQTVPVAISPAP